jgi:hypothetical protein
LDSSLVRELVALFSETAGSAAADREVRLRARLDTVGLGSALADVLIVAERAARASASREELGLALGAVVALERNRTLREGGS